MSVTFDLLAVFDVRGSFWAAIGQINTGRFVDNTDTLLEQKPDDLQHQLIKRINGEHQGQHGQHSRDDNWNNAVSINGKSSHVAPVVSQR